MVRVLIVDDEPDFVELIREFVTRNGYEPLLAYNGPEALCKVKEERPHIVLLDIRMPKMDGIEVLQKIREIDREVGVIMLTAVNDSEVGRQSLRLGAFDYLVKPLDFKYLERVLWYKIATMTV
jgi:DNA-binding response OmpR family regulator